MFVDIVATFHHHVIRTTVPSQNAWFYDQGEVDFPVIQFHTYWDRECRSCVITAVYAQYCPFGAQYDWRHMAGDLVNRLSSTSVHVPDLSDVERFIAHVRLTTLQDRSMTSA